MNKHQIGKEIRLTVAFVIVWTLAAGVCYLIGRMAGQDPAAEWTEYAVIGFAGATAAIFGPILTAWFDKRFKKKS